MVFLSQLRNLTSILVWPYGSIYTEKMRSAESETHVDTDLVWE